MELQNVVFALCGLVIGFLSNQTMMGARLARLETKVEALERATRAGA